MTDWSDWPIVRSADEYYRRKLAEPLFRPKEEPVTIEVETREQVYNCTGIMADPERSDTVMMLFPQTHTVRLFASAIRRVNVVIAGGWLAGQATQGCDVTSAPAARERSRCPNCGQ